MNIRAGIGQGQNRAGVGLGPGLPASKCRGCWALGFGAGIPTMLGLPVGASSLGDAKASRDSLRLHGTLSDHTI